MKLGRLPASNLASPLLAYMLDGRGAYMLNQLNPVVQPMGLQSQLFFVCKKNR